MRHQMKADIKIARLTQLKERKLNQLRLKKTRKRQKTEGIRKTPSKQRV